jgi:hypothetical protein
MTVARRRLTFSNSSGKFSDGEGVPVNLSSVEQAETTPPGLKHERLLLFSLGLLALITIFTEQISA